MKLAVSIDFQAPYVIDMVSGCNDESRRLITIS